MAQRMPQPWKHPKTGIYYFRKVVPVALREALGGRTEYRVSLGTKNLAEAKRKYPEVAARVDAELEQAKGGPVALSQKQVAALAGLWYTRQLALYEENPGDEQRVVGWEVWQDDLTEAGHEDRMSEVVRPQVEALLKEEGLTINQVSRARLDEAIFWNALRLSEMMQTRAAGDYTPDKFLGTIPAWQRPVVGAPEASSAGSGDTFDALIKAWAAEKKPVERTLYEWERAVRRLSEHVGHTDPARVTPEDVIAWKAKLLASGKGTKTINNQLFAISVLYRWAIKNRRLTLNPAAGASIAVKKRAGERMLSFSDADAATLLIAARKEKGARRWVPWLLAFTGARLEEVCQSLVPDIGKEGEVHYLDINANGPGKSLKNIWSERKVPLHSAVIAEGFLRYVAKLPVGGPLFPDLKPDRFGRRGGNGTKTIGRWVRSLGITDNRKAPNHAWRHRFEDKGRAAGITKELRDVLTGHKIAGEGTNYGSDGYPLGVLAAAVEKLPSPL